MLVLPLAFALAACASDPAPTDSTSQPSTPQASPIETLLMACVGGDLEDSVDMLDSLLAVSPEADLYAVRSGCLHRRFARDSVRADAELAMADLDAALADPSGGGFFKPHELYSRRAFMHLALAPEAYSEAMGDFDRAVELEPERPGYLLDRATARALSGDEAGAREDLERVLAQPTLAPELAAAARQRLDALE